MMTPERTVGRLSLYRRLLVAMRNRGTKSVFSHELASAAGVTAAQVRRDMMVVGCSGSPAKGYDVRELIEHIGLFLDSSEPESVGLVGVGNIGRAMMAYFEGRRPKLKMVAAFDSDPSKVNRVVHGCRCYAMEDMARVVAERGIQVAMVAVPAESAQEVADVLVRCGVRGLLNFAPMALRVPEHVYVEDIDVTTSLEKVAFFARSRRANKVSVS
ncbi:MAG: redox-sensing transcriptional repressor Rex [Planctomycetes bacterium]|nr:redox-sensing transcriptional repressor Rex [Planctomycetota bacterium]